MEQVEALNFNRQDPSTECAQQSFLAKQVQSYRTIRARTETLAANLSAEDQQLQSMPDASPTKWHRAHTTWFFETFVLQNFKNNYRPYHPDFQRFFNSYYESVGTPFFRHQRGLLSRPSCEEIRDYRLSVDAQMEQLLEQGTYESRDETRLFSLLRLGLEHEQQHQELLLTDILHAFSQNPLWPSFGPNSELCRDLAEELAPHQATASLHFDEGIYSIGCQEDSFHFDNEAPRHQVYLQAFALDQQPLNNQAVLDFIESGGYQDPLLWLSDGWAWCKKEKRTHPHYWRNLKGGTYEELTLRGAQPVAAHRVACHLTYFEVDAIARFLGSRLPTEYEWEVAASSAQLSNLGSVWEWTSSAYQAYPGFCPEKGAVGEYNGKFMHGQQVLRGSSIATAPGHSRSTYRNFFPASTYFQFSGARLAHTR